MGGARLYPRLTCRYNGYSDPHHYTPVFLSLSRSLSPTFCLYLSLSFSRALSLPLCGPVISCLKSTEDTSFDIFWVGDLVGNSGRVARDRKILEHNHAAHTLQACAPESSHVFLRFNRAECRQSI